MCVQIVRQLLLPLQYICEVLILSSYIKVILVLLIEVKGILKAGKILKLPWKQKESFSLVIQVTGETTLYLSLVILLQQCNSVFLFENWFINEF